jgi:AraC-like DNA-binding protein
MKNFDIDSIKTELVFRSMGGVNSRERMGAGFIKKHGIKVDFSNVDYPHYALVYILKGRGIYIDETGRKYELEPGNYFQRFPGEPVGWIGINPPLIERYKKAAEKLKAAEEEELPQMLAYLISLAMDTLSLARKSAEDKEAESIVEKACNFLSSNLGEHAEIKDFCKANACGYEKFRKLFFEKIGISPGKYRIRRRIDTACQMLNASPKSIGAISSELGYSSPYDFSSQFKKYMGVSPSRFRSGK